LSAEQLTARYHTSASDVSAERLHLAGCCIAIAKAPGTVLMCKCGRKLPANKLSGYQLPASVLNQA